MREAALVYVTCPSEDVAAHIAKAIIEERHAACANILPMGRSFFHWDGAVQEARECTVIFKTTNDKLPDIDSAIIKLHPYEVPCILAVPVLGGHETFLKWIGETVNEPL